MVGLSGLEPPTSCLSGMRSNHLSYRPIYGGDKETRTLGPLRARQLLSQLSYTPDNWAWEDLNLRPHAYQACALTT